MKRPSAQKMYPVAANATTAPRFEATFVNLAGAAAVRKLKPRPRTKSSL
jgi:hypothetical protein